jgi:Tfp pilus assembly protein PilF
MQDQRQKRAGEHTGLDILLDTVKAHVDRGFDRLQEQKFEEAIRYFDEAIRLDRRAARAFYGRAQSWHSLKETESALSDYDEAIRLDPKVAGAFFNRGRLRFERREAGEAIADYTEAVRLDPKDAYSYWYRATARLQQGEQEKAVSDFDEAIRLESDKAGLYFQRGLARRELGQQEEALQDLSQAVRLDPRMAEAFRTRSLLWQEKGDHARAQEDFATANQIAAGAVPRSSKAKKKMLISPLLQEHFQPESIDNITITERNFPFRMRADLQRAINGLFTLKTTIAHFCGVSQRFSHEALDFSGLVAPSSHEPPVSVPPQYEEIDIGEAEPVRCLKNGLWLLQEGQDKFAVLLAPASRHGIVTGLKFQVATVNNREGTRITQEFFKHLEDSVLKSESYRGKILSLEVKDRYSGASTGLLVHQLRAVSRDEVILPRKTLELLDRNVIEFTGQRPRLAQYGLSTKKGLLFYGPPGTGKTHTIHYLAGALKGHTTFLITAEQVGLLGEYMTLARLLQPSVVVIEDVDLIARDRGSMEDPCEEVLLNKLLNEMDGLRPDADVLFILTTNRPESLEMALASRPGRVDQAIEFPLPDGEGRAKLIRLYSHGLSVPQDVIAATVKKTENVSASFIKELMRRSAQFHFEAAKESPDITLEDVDAALEELLFTGGSLNRKLLGAEIQDEE